jgi:hypothetical protein
VTIVGGSGAAREASYVKDIEVGSLNVSYDEYNTIIAYAGGAAPASAPAPAPSPAPPTVPDPPTSVSAIAGNEQATVSFTVPVNNGGSAIISYTVTSDPDGLTATGSASPIVITGLTNDTPYTFTVVATNSVGDSDPSSASDPVTPTFIDQILASLTTSLSAYNAAADDEWVTITSTEYTNLQTNITGTTKAGLIDSYFVGATGSGLANNNSALVANSLTTASPAIPANNYLYAFSVRWVTALPAVGMRVYTNANSAAASGFNQVGSALPSTTAAGMAYYVRKGAATTNGATAGLLGCFTGTKMDYPNPNFTGSAAYIGFKTLQGTPITPIPGMLYLTGNGSVPAANSTLTGNLGGYGAFNIQGLTTATKQWI